MPFCALVKTLCTTGDAFRVLRTKAEATTTAAAAANNNRGHIKNDSKAFT
jgi:hypothetical protein